MNKKHYVDTVKMGIQLNNGKEVLKLFSEEELSGDEYVLTMTQGNKYSPVELSDENIVENSEFIVSLWD